MANQLQHAESGGRIGRVLIHIVLPVAFGSIVYILWRAPTLRVFRWIEALGLLNAVLQLRHWSRPATAILPTWFLFRP